jgi:hypothetical protein
MAIGLGEEVRGDLLSTVGRREGVHALRQPVHGTLQVGPRPVDRDVRFDQAPATYTGRSRRRKVPSPGEQYFTTTCLLLASLMDAWHSSSSSSSWRSLEA